MTRRAHGPAVFAGALLLYVALAILLTARTWLSPGDRWVGGCCDPEQTMWFLRWVPSAIEQGVDPFVTFRMNAPEGVNLMWNAWTPLVGLLLAPVTVVAGPLAAYNIAIVGAIATSSLAAFAALRRYAPGIAGPLLGGAVYGFSPYVISHASIHLNLALVWAPPVMLVLLDELLVRRHHRASVLGLAIGVMAGFQVLVFEEVLATGAVAAAVFAAMLAITVRDRELIRQGAVRVARAFVPALAGLVVVAGIPLAVQFAGPLRLTQRVQETERFGTDLLNLVVPTRFQLLAPIAATGMSDQFSVLYHEATAYVGLPLLVILGVTVWRRWADLRIRIGGLMALAMLILSLGQGLRIGNVDTGIPMPWLLFSQLPLLEHALPGRLTVYMWLAVGSIVAILVSDLAKCRASYAAPRLVVLGLASCS